jgi:hypothetical protein
VNPRAVPPAMHSSNLQGGIFAMRFFAAALFVTNAFAQSAQTLKTRNGPNNSHHFA